MTGALVCGLDEAGRGPWAGPVCAGAVLAEAERIPRGVDDSKRLSPERREILARAIRECCGWALGWASAHEIDRLNIRHATHLAMQRAIAALPAGIGRDRRRPVVLVDGVDPPPLDRPRRAIVGGDGLVPVIGAASILAKTARDRLMRQLDDLYPGYGFARHKGYGVPDHRDALGVLGPCPAHRLSFRPVRAALAQGSSPAVRLDGSAGAVQYTPRNRAGKLGSQS